MTVRVLDPVGVELDAPHIGGVDEADVDEMQHLLADYGVVGDLFKVVPQAAEEIRKRK